MLSILPPGPSLADVGRSAAAAVGVAGFADTLEVGPARHVVVCLIDGLGWSGLRAHPAHAPTMSALSGAPIGAAFPTTTPVGLGSLGTGLLPGGHGLVGAAFWYPETAEVLSPLQWGSHPTPVAVQPEPTVFERVARAGVAVTTAAPGAYADSGLTRAVLRGGSYAPAEDAAARIDVVRRVQSDAGRTFTYVYWPELDREGHEHGVDSVEWRSALGRADDLVAGLIEVLGPGSAMVVTADHGMVDCPPDQRILLESDRRLMADVERISGEPRARHVYVRPGAADDVRDTWQGILGDRAVVKARRDLVDEGWFGEVDPSLAERIGDVMAVACGPYLLASTVDATVSGLLGQHGAVTVEEVLVPALIHRVE